jgi:uncharacterized protein YecE (DUF72 family)
MTRENLRKVDEFFSSIEGSFTFIWEPRDYPEDLSGFVEVLKKHGIIECVDPLVSQPCLDQEINYFRLHGTYEGKRIIYSHTYSDKELFELRRKTEKFSNPYVMFNNKTMFQDALRFKSQN